MAKIVALIILLIAVVAASARRESSSCEMEMKQMPMRRCMMSILKGKMRSYLEECCSELQRMSSQCRCDAVKEMVMDMQQQYGEMEEMEKMERIACSLPRMCGMTEECHSCSSRRVSA